MKAGTCNATRTLLGMRLVCDRVTGHGGKHADDSMGPGMHFAWDDPEPAPPTPEAHDDE